MPANESPLLVHIWSVRPDEQMALVERLDTMIRQVIDDPGFLSGRILTSADGLAVAALIEMKTPDDRQRLQELPQVREALRHVSGAYNVVVKLFEEAGTYGAASDRRATAEADITSQVSGAACDRGGADAPALDPHSEGPPVRHQRRDAADPLALDPYSPMATGERQTDDR